eukprot:TRINITY_DN34653_c0_g1_i1.p1 TRINITY_DN34653_c0_g1~~TRINITY_DN34653_c0_g1_i1.p1  ORF type:complete len:178 (+),score=26.48 TRINITY_DN34653_c0_g1_i1:40-534(+)
MRLATGDAAPTKEYTGADAHLLPCSIQFNGLSDIDTYFSKHVKVEEPRVNGTEPETSNNDQPTNNNTTPVMTVMLRGRELRGVTMSTTPEYTLHLLKKDPETEEWATEGRLASFTHWSRDADPLVQTVGVTKLLREWPELSKTLATTVTDEALEAAYNELDKKE